MLVLVPGKVVSSVNISPVPCLGNIFELDLIPRLEFWWELTLWEDVLGNSTPLSVLSLEEVLDGALWLSDSLDCWCFVLLDEGVLVSLISTPSILGGGPGTVSLNSDVVNTSDDSEETIFTEVGSP